MSPLVWAQEKYEISENDYTNSSVEMADSFRSDGKIYVVVAVMVTLLAVLIFYVIRVDSRVSRLEKEVEDYLEKNHKVS